VLSHQEAHLHQSEQSRFKLKMAKNGKNFYNISLFFFLME